MNRADTYKDIERFRRTRNRQKKRRNDKSRTYAYNQFAEWTLAEDKIVLEHKMSDREIAKLIGRSISAVMVRRSKLKSLQDKTRL